ncbi:MAG: hypothetical protein KDD98_03460 [Sphingomonadaceae bacterium]|nr:hypothetical protein [Sphingomonadaceae bacterium]
MAVLIGLGVTGYCRLRQAVLAIALMVIILVAAQWLMRAAHHELWDADTRSTARRLLIMLIEVRLIRVLAEIVGHIWYQIVASLGLAAVGTVFLARQLFKPKSDEFWPAVFVLAAVLAVYAASLGQMMEGDRVEQLTYGRYLDGVCILLLWLGAAAMLSDGRKTPIFWPLIAAYAFAAAAMLPIWAWQHLFNGGPAHPNNVAGIGWWVWEGASL